MGSIADFFALKLCHFWLFEWLIVYKRFPTRHDKLWTFYAYQRQRTLFCYLCLKFHTCKCMGSAAFNVLNECEKIIKNIHAALDSACMRASILRTLSHTRSSLVLNDINMCRVAPNGAYICARGVDGMPMRTLRRV